MDHGGGWLSLAAVTRVAKGIVEVARIVAVSAEEAWALLIDTERWAEWGPSITAVECSTRFIGAGSRGRVRTVMGFWLSFEIVRFDAGHAWSWRVAGIPATGHRVEPLGTSHCRVVFEVPRLAGPYSLVCRLALRRIQRVLMGTPPMKTPPPRMQRDR
jgi:hypothetical protein